MNTTLRHRPAPAIEVRHREYSLSSQALTDLDVSRAHPAHPVTPLPAALPAYRPVTEAPVERSLEDLAFYD